MKYLKISGAVLSFKT